MVKMKDKNKDKFVKSGKSRITHFPEKYEEQNFVSDQNSKCLLTDDFTTNNEKLWDYLTGTYGSLDINYFTDVLQDGKYKNNFRLNKMIGIGSYGEVFEVRDKSTLDVFAIKKIEIRNLREERIFFENFRGFSKIRDSTDDEFIAQYFDACIEKDISQKKLFLYFQMELFDANLESFLKNFHNDINSNKSNSLTLTEFSLARDIFIEILNGINFLHQQNPQIIHKNLKPQNILLKIKRNFVLVKIADFDFMGFQYFTERTLISFAHERDFKYIAPELLDYCEYDTKADIYSLGVILKELFVIDLKK
jgi:serine/threonine protein kinase